MLVGQSPPIMKLKKMIREIAKTDDSALLIGEVGVGKKQVAREIHQRSRQKNRPFVILNCTAIGDTLTDGDLFGETAESERGVERKIGLLEQAQKGILYLENVNELSPDYQQRFINILKEKRFRKPGEDEIIHTDFRVLASAADERTLQGSGFRADLLALISTFTLNIPPLRNRRQDIPYLFTHFLKQYYEETNQQIPPIPAEIFESLMEYEWRGNIFELKNTVRNLVMMSPEGELSVEYLPFEIKKHPFEFLNDRDLPEAVSEVERYLIRKALKRFAGNQSKAARALNVSEAALRYKMKKYGLTRKAF